MGKPEGGRIHEHAIRAAHSALELDGWTLARIRNLNVPLIAARDGKARLGGHAAYGWIPEGIQDIENPTPTQAAWQTLLKDHEPITIGHWTDYEDLRGQHFPNNGMPQFFDAITSDLERTAQEWETEGWRVVRNWHRTRNGHLGMRQPDGVAIRRNEVWAIEATTVSPRKRIGVYTRYDGVVCARFHGRQIFQADNPPMVRIQFWKDGEVVA